MALGFQISAGTIPGRTHVGSGNLLIGKNNQDSFVLQVLDNCIIATVQDGCSSGANSEIGANVGGRILSRLIYDSICSGALLSINSFSEASIQLEKIRKRLLNKISKLADCLEIPSCSCARLRACNCGVHRVLHDLFLFTTVGLVVTERNTIIFSIGDGLYALNGEVTELGPFPENAPPYLAYSLLPSAFDGKGELLNFTVQAFLPTDQLNTAMIATDGLKELIGKDALNVPGKSRQVGQLQQLWSEDRFYDDEQNELITPWLRQVNSEVVRMVTHQQTRLERNCGLLADDTTVIALRRKIRRGSI